VLGIAAPLPDFFHQTWHIMLMDKWGHDVGNVLQDLGDELRLLLS
jgi:hypothetical protein